VREKIPLQDESDPRSPVRIDAQPAYLAVTNAGAFLLGTLLVFLLSRIPLLLSPLAFWALVIVLGAALSLEILSWYRKGPRSITIEKDGVRLERGSSRTILWLEWRMIADVRMTRSVRGRRIRVDLRDGKRKSASGPVAAFLRRIAAHIPGLKPHLIITANVFSTAQFLGMLSVLTSRGRRPIVIP
jgi:hypothetical protein